MDNFGIFKLLNSFFDYYQNKNSSTSKENIAQNTEKEEPKSTPEQTVPKQKPLQNTMLKTMENHQEILARVLKNNHKK